jgi:hypothetical protein
VSTLIVKNLDAPTGESIVAPDLTLPSGSVVQVKQVKLTDSNEVSVDNGDYSNTSGHVEINPNTRLTITPTSATNKLLVQLASDVKMSSGNSGTWVGVKRDNSYLYTGAANGSNGTDTEGGSGHDSFLFHYTSDTGANNHSTFSQQILIDADSTNATTFSVWLARHGTTGISQVGSWSPTTLTVWEIAG